MLCLALLTLFAVAVCLMRVCCVLFWAVAVAVLFGLGWVGLGWVVVVVVESALLFPCMWSSPNPFTYFLGREGRIFFLGVGRAQPSGKGLIVASWSEEVYEVNGYLTRRMLELAKDKSREREEKKSKK